MNSLDKVDEKLMREEVVIHLHKILELNHQHQISSGKAILSISEYLQVGKLATRLLKEEEDAN